MYGKVMKRVTHSLIAWSRRSAANHGAGYCMNVSMLLISRGPLLKHALMKGFMCAPKNKPAKSCSLQENKNNIWTGSTELEQQSPVTLFAIAGARHWTWETFFFIIIIFLNIFYRFNSLPPRSCHQEAEVMTQMPSVSLTPCLVLLFIAGFIAVFLRPQLRQSLRAWSLTQTHREDSPGQGLTVCKRGLQSASGYGQWHTEPSQETHKIISAAWRRHCLVQPRNHLHNDKWGCQWEGMLRENTWRHWPEFCAHRQIRHSLVFVQWILLIEGIFCSIWWAEVWFLWSECCDQQWERWWRTCSRSHWIRGSDRNKTQPSSAPSRCQGKSCWRMQMAINKHPHYILTGFEWNPDKTIRKCTESDL